MRGKTGKPIATHMTLFLKSNQRRLFVIVYFPSIFLFFPEVALTKTKQINIHQKLSLPVDWSGNRLILNHIAVGITFRLVFFNIFTVPIKKLAKFKTNLINSVFHERAIPQNYALKRIWPDLNRETVTLELWWETLKVYFSNYLLVYWTGFIWKLGSYEIKYNSGQENLHNSENDKF